jgi:hypothetical protein
VLAGSALFNDSTEGDDVMGGAVEEDVAAADAPCAAWLGEEEEEEAGGMSPHATRMAVGVMGDASS